MTVYACVLFTSVLLALWADAAAKTRDGGMARPRRLTAGAVLVFVVLAGVSALRWRVGTDYWAYDLNFLAYANEFSTSIHLFSEPGIRLIAWLSETANAGSAGMFALAAIVTVGLIVFTTWKWGQAFAFSIAVFILSGAWHGSFNGVRQYLAAAILFAGHRYIIERRLIRWLLVVLVATLFHVSAIVGILMYFVPRKRISLLAQLLIILSAVAVMAGTAEFLQFFESQSDDPNAWRGEYVQRSVNPLRVAFNCLPLILYWLLSTRKQIVDEGDWFYANMLVVAAAAVIAGAGSAYLTRFAIFTSLFIPISLALITSLSDKRERAIIRTGVLAAMAVFMYVEVSSVENLRNFQWIFNKE